MSSSSSRVLQNNTRQSHSLNTKTSRTSSDHDFWFGDLSVSDFDAHFDGDIEDNDVNNDVVNLDDLKSDDAAETDGTLSASDIAWDFNPSDAIAIESVLDGVFDLALPYARTLELYCETISHSRTAEDMLYEASENGWLICFAELGQGDFKIHVPEQIIIINNFGMGERALQASPYFTHCAQINLIRALREVWHEKRSGAFEDNYGMDDILMLERVRAADLDVIALLCTWEVRCEGGFDRAADLWRHMLGSDLSEMATTFAKTYECYAIEDDATAMRAGLFAAFETWYSGAERVNGCDHDTLEGLDMMIHSADSDIDLDKRNLIAQGVEILSCLPDRSAYLKGKGAEILSSIKFAGLYSEINQTHYMHLRKDMGAVIVNDVAFRDSDLAARIFPSTFSPLKH